MAPKYYGYAPNNASKGNTSQPNVLKFKDKLEDLFKKNAIQPYSIELYSIVFK